MRTLVPAETLVYLETNDLAGALQPIVDSKPFTEVAKSKPDFSALKGVQLAVAVTGFETSEEKLTDEHSVGRVQPHFVAVADTHAWNYQAVAFAEKKLGSFVTEIYDSEPTLEKSNKNGGKYFIWKAKDGRKAYALVIDSIIYFGNDETAIDKCLAVKRGEADSVAKSGKVQTAAPGTLASGYVGPDGIAQIANIIGLKFASEVGEDSEVQSAIAGILPQLLRNSITDVTWTATKTEQGIEDRYIVTILPDIASVFNETLKPSDSDSPAIEFIPADAPTATYYNLRDPMVSWRSILLTGQKQAGPRASVLFEEFSKALFAPYGIRDPEMFLSGAGTNILTANLDADGEKPVVIAEVMNPEKIRKSLLIDTRPYQQWPADLEVQFRTSSDGDLAAAFIERYIVVGDADSVRTCVKQKLKKVDAKGGAYFGLLGEPKRAAATIGTDVTSARQIVDIISGEKSDNGNPRSTFFTETRFTKTGIERRTISDFGLIGSIIAQLAQD
ncbi:MAG: hypothetical protein KA746_08705 [Pyrinomonadaceae bacterium]|nr:hypothetical protein [Pyrinomonadaceae bacterium]MBP6213750.1 hypothetical protein [Pyrinomonadaceae bacterium]